MNLVRLAVTVTCTLLTTRARHMTEGTPLSWLQWLVQRLAHGQKWATQWQHPLKIFCQSYFILFYFCLELVSWKPPGDILERHRLKNKVELGWERDEKWRAGVLKTCFRSWHQLCLKLVPEKWITFFARLVWVEFSTFKTQRIMINTEDYLFV